jgi:uncharacterized protein (TIGR02145 family)
MKIFQLLLLALLVIILANCTDDNSTNPDDTIESVKIGAQTWMKKNLDVDHYRNGDPIPQVTDSTVWENLKTGAWCYYNNDSTLGKIYGKLYNWYAVNDPRGLAPEGWHVPSDSEWVVLFDYLGGDTLAGGKMKVTDTAYWAPPNYGATNESGFSALPGGWRGADNTAFFDLGAFGYWWSATARDDIYVIYWFLSYSSSVARSSSHAKIDGFSVRCVRD